MDMILHLKKLTLEIQHQFDICKQSNNDDELNNLERLMKNYLLEFKQIDCNIRNQLFDLNNTNTIDIYTDDDIEVMELDVYYERKKNNENQNDKKVFGNTLIPLWSYGSQDRIIIENK